MIAYDGVRPGLALYGSCRTSSSRATAPASGLVRLRPAMALYARPVRVTTLPEGWGISYGPTYRTRRISRIATLPVGYGDGWSRALSNRAVGACPRLSRARWSATWRWMP